MPSLNVSVPMKGKKVKGLLERRRLLNRKIEKLNGTIQVYLVAAFERHFETGAETYFKMEEQLYNFEGLFKSIEDQGNQAETPADFSRIAERLSYVEDRLDEFQSALYNRPMKRRSNRFNLFNFFSQFSQNKSGAGDGVSSEVGSLHEAYTILGLEEGSAFSKVTTAFRHFVKNYHPDARGGDRSNEAKLRLVVEAYQFIKQAR